MSDEPLAIICAPDDGSLKIPGSVRETCHDCGTAIVIAPSGQNIHKDNPTSILICMACGMNHIKTDPDPQIMPLSSEQKSEIVEWMKDNRKETR